MSSGPTLWSFFLIVHVLFIDCQIWITHIMFHTIHTNRMGNQCGSINPLVTNDAYMHPIIECMKVPMTHMIVKGESVNFNVCSDSTSGQCLWAFHYKFSSPSSTSWLHFRLPWPLALQENKRQTLHKPAKLLSLWTYDWRRDRKLVRG